MFVHGWRLLFLSFSVATPKAMFTSPINSDIFSLSQLHSGRSGKHLLEKKESLLEVMKKAPLGVLPLWTSGQITVLLRKTERACEASWKGQGNHQPQSWSRPRAERPKEAVQSNADPVTSRLKVKQIKPRLSKMIFEWSHETLDPRIYLF